jgi:hypothetical protein
MTVHTDLLHTVDLFAGPAKWLLAKRPLGKSVFGIGQKRLWLRRVIASASGLFGKPKCPPVGVGTKLHLVDSAVTRAKNSIRNIKISASIGRASCSAIEAGTSANLRIKCFNDDK